MPTIPGLGEGSPKRGDEPNWVSGKGIQFDERLLSYLRDHSSAEPDILRRLREETATHPASCMQIPPEQGQLLSFLLELTGATRVLELGTFTGYSSLLFALSIPRLGVVVTCDNDSDTTATARRYWEEAGVEHKIDFRLGEASDSLQQLQSEAQEPFDFIFIDADKSKIVEYYEGCLELLKPGGLLVIDNILWSGRVLDSNFQDEETKAIRDLNRLVRDDSRVRAINLPLADGIKIALKL